MPTNQPKTEAQQVQVPEQMPQEQQPTAEIHPSVANEPEWTPSDSIYRNLQDKDATPDYLKDLELKHTSGTELEDQKLDGHDVRLLCEHPNTPKESLKRLLDFYSSQPSSYNTNQAIARIASNPNSPYELHEKEIQRYLNTQPDEDFDSDYIDKSINRNETSEEKIKQAILHSLKRKQDYPFKEAASKVDPKWLYDTYKEGKSNADDNFHQLNVDGDWTRVSDKITDYFRALIEHPNHTEESLSNVHNDVLSNAQLGDALALVKNQPKLTHRQIEDLFNTFIQTPNDLSHKENLFASSALNHPNIDPAFVASKINSGNDLNSIALSSSKLPNETINRIIDDSIQSNNVGNLEDILSNQNLPSDSVHKIYSYLANRTDGGMWGSVRKEKAFHHPNFSEDKINEAWEQSPKDREAAKLFLSRERLPTSVLKDIITKGNPKDAARAVSHPSTDKDVLQIASKRKSKDVKEAVAKHPLADNQNVTDFAMSGHADPIKYWTQLDSKLSEPQKAEVHQKYYDKLLKLNPNRAKENEIGASALSLFRSNHINDDQKSNIVKMAFDHYDDYSYKYGDRRHFKAVMDEALDGGNDYAIDHAIDKGIPFIANLSNLDKMKNPKFLDKIINKTLAEPLEDNYSQNVIANRLLSNPNLNDDNLIKIVTRKPNSKDSFQSLVNIIGSGAFDKHIALKSPENKTEFLNKLSQTPNGDILTFFNPSTPIETKKSIFNNMAQENFKRLNDLVINPEYNSNTLRGLDLSPSTIKAIKDVPSDLKLKLYKSVMDHAKRTYLGSSFSKIFDPAQTSAKDILNLFPREDWARNIVDGAIPNEYNFDSNFAMDLLNTDSNNPNAFIRYVDTVGKADSNKLKEIIQKFKSNDPNITGISNEKIEDGILTLMGSKFVNNRLDSESKKGSMDFLIEPESSRFLSDDFIQEALPIAMSRGYIGKDAEIKINSDPKYFPTVINSESTTWPKRSKLIENAVNSENIPESMYNAIKNCLSGSGFQGAGQSPQANFYNYTSSQDAGKNIAAKISKECIKRNDLNSFQNNIATYATSIGRSPATIIDMWNDIKNNDTIDPKTKNDTIINSYEQLLSAMSGERSKENISSELDPYIVDQLMQSKDFDGFLKMAFQHKSAVFSDALDALISNPETLSDQSQTKFLKTLSGQNLIPSNLKIKSVINFISNTYPQNYDNKIYGANILANGLSFAKNAREHSQILTASEKTIQKISQDIQKAPKDFGDLQDKLIKAKNKLAVSICLNSQDINKQLKAVSSISDDATEADDSIWHLVRSNKIGGQTINSPEFLEAIKNKKWAGNLVAKQIGNIQKSNQGIVSDIIINNLLDPKNSSQNRGSTVAYIINSNSDIKTKEFTDKIFGALNLDDQIAMISNLEPSYVQDEQYMDKFQFNVEQLADGNDPTTGKSYDKNSSEFQDKLNRSISLMRKRIRYINGNDENLENNKTTCINKTASIINKIMGDKTYYTSPPNLTNDSLLNDLSINGAALFDYMNADTKYDKENISKLIDNIIPNLNEPRYFENMMLYPHISLDGAEKIILRDINHVQHLARNKNLDGNKIRMIAKHVMPVIDQYPVSDAAFVLSDILENSQNTNSLNESIPLIAEIINSKKTVADSAIYNKILANKQPITEQDANYLIERGNFPIQSIICNAHGGQKLYDKFIESNQQLSPNDIEHFIAHPNFDDRGVDVIFNSVENKAMFSSRGKSNAIRLIIQSGEKISEQKFNEIIDKNKDLINENPSMLTESPYLSYENLIKLHNEISPRYGDRITIGSSYSPTYTNISFGAKLFREMYTQKMPYGFRNVSDEKTIKQYAHKIKNVQLEKLMQVLPSEGMEWVKFKKQFKEMENYPEVKKLFNSKNNKPLMPEDVANEIAKTPEQDHHITYSEWDGGQRHNSNQKNLVLQINTGESFDQELKSDPKLWGIYQWIQRSANGFDGNNAGGHPTTPHIIGWIRLDVSNPDTVIAEEFQSDFNQRLIKIVRGALRKKNNIKIGANIYTDKEVYAYAKRITEVFKNFNESAHEILERFAKNQGMKKIFIHGLGIRKSLSGVPQDQYVSVFQEAYQDIPEKRGYEKCNYGDYPNASPHLKDKEINQQCWVKTIS